MSDSLQFRDSSRLGSPVLHYLPEFAQIYVPFMDHSFVVKGPG